MLSPERWQLVEQVFHEALQRPPGERRSFIASSCAGDDDVRREVESLLAADTSFDGGDDLVQGVVTDWAADTRPAEMAGREIGGYRVVSLLGEGGMGEVYLADDLSLGRRVALKLLPAPFTSDTSRLRRFTEEARAASALNHPNIITVHQIGEFDGRRFIVTEFIDGDTLRRRIHQGPLPEGEAVDIAVQAARALRAAHHAGIIHRDIKPENLMIRRDGYVKVLDFGLAKLAPDEQVTAGHGTEAHGAPRTRVGAVLGTPNYMAPEQAMGGTVDARADIFALSVVLSEMVTGVLPVESSGAPKDGVRPHAQPSPALARILARGLAARPAERYQKLDELIDDLEALRAPASKRLASEMRRRRVPLSVAAIAILIAVAAWGGWRIWSRTPLASSLAVLPLANVGGDPDFDYLGDGITDGVIAKLSRTPNLKVIARSTAFQFKGREVEPVAVGRELRVDAVLSGRVVPQGDTAEVELQLVDVASGDVLWRDSMSVRPAAAVALEDEVATRLAARLRLPETTADAPMNPEAHTLYLKARYQLNTRTPEGLREARRLFDQAITLEPGNAELHAGLAETWALIGAYSILPPADSFPRAIAAARNALERDDSLAEARTTLGLCLFLYEWQWAAAEAEFRRAIDTRPGYATAHHWFAEYLMARGRTDEAVTSLRRARELDPLSLVIAVDTGRAYYFGRRFAEARAECARALDVSPDFAPAVDCLAQVAVQEGRYDEAITGYTEVSRLWGDDAGLPGLAVALAGAGRRAEAEAIWVQLTAPGRAGYVQIPALVYIQSALGGKDEAFRLLEQARAGHANNLPYLKTDARVDALRDDPRWAEFSREIGFD